LIVAVVPADSVPAAAALATAAERLEMVSPAVTVKVKVLPVDASLIVVTEPAVRGKVADKGGAVDPWAEVYVVEAATNGGVLLAVPPNT
jgi:hypothetical protein